MSTDRGAGTGPRKTTKSAAKRERQREAARIAREQLAHAERRRRMRWTAIIAAAALVLAGVIGYGVYAQQQKDKVEPAATVPNAVSADRSGVVAGSGPVTVDLYEDFTCPYCKSFEQATKGMIDEYLRQGRIRVVFHPMSILDSQTANEYSTRAAVASGCASDGGKLMEYVAAVFDHQPPEDPDRPGPTNDQLVEYGRAVGLDSPEFAACVTDQRYADWVREVTARASKAGVRGTPTVKVNGKDIRTHDNKGNPLTDPLKNAIDKA